ncbi:MAG: hypothetical protein E7576_00635 [Ruminococcaceae bacterium]|jgi:formate C-acetyltransferase|nr:hypothetical protein [Oscillospiraceae bacterium]
MNAYDKPRIDRLRERALKPAVSYDEFYSFFNAAYLERYGNPSFKCRLAEAVREAYSRWTVDIEPGELIVGRPASSPHTPEEEERFRRANEAARFSHCAVGQDSHMAIDYPRLLSLGTSGIRALIDRHIAALDPDDPRSVRKEDFYRAAKICLEGVEILSKRYADRADELAETEPDPTQREEYRTIAEICRKVPLHPAETFREAAQSAAFVTYALSVKPLRPSLLQFQLGHPDRWLAPYYERDKAAGILTDGEAQTLIDCLCVQINRRVPNGLSCGLMVGGSLADGTTVSNPLTRMFLEAIRQVGLVYPSVGLCVTEDTPEEDLDLALEILAEGHSHPALFGDATIRRGLSHYGLTAEESAEYIHSTCVEITPVGCSNVWVASPYMNLPGELLAVFPSCDTDAPATMEDFVGRYFGRVAGLIRENCRRESLYRYERAKYCADPLLSCFVRDCLERGVDIEEGGARYNWIMPSFVGVANAADALYAIRTLIYERHETTFADWKQALDTDYRDDPALLARIRSLPKYGSDDRSPDSPDAYVKTIADFLASECEKHRVPLTDGDGERSGRLIPSLFCWIMHDHFGRSTGATPDGRHAGFPLGDGSGPAQGREACGPTASVLSSTSWEHWPFIGGVAVNMKFSKSLFTPDSLPVMKSIVKTYLARGGFEMQINVTDRETLERARIRPEEYEDLIVRIGGYSDYFTRLSPTMQEEVILRTEHGI